MNFSNIVCRINVKVTVGVFLSIITVRCFSQDVHFSQFEITPIQVNPAATGANGSYELIIGYRKQWKKLDQSFTTPVATGILPIVSKTNMIKGGLGLSAISNSSGKSGYKTSGGTLAYSYGVNFKNAVLLGGISTSFFQRSLSNEFSTGAQYQSGSGYNSSLSNGEQSNQSKSFFDFGLGIYACDKSNFSYFGIAAHHLNQPELGLVGSDKLLMRYSIHGGYRLMRKSSIQITPEFLLNYRKDGLQRTILGAKLDYQIKDGKGFAKDLYFGIIGRYAFNDALIFGLSLTKKYLTVGISQDITTSKVSGYNSGIGATEVRLSIRIPSKRKQITAVTESYNIGDARQIVIKREEERDNTKSYTLHLQENVKFAFNDTSLTKEGKRITEDVVQLLKGNKYLKVRIIGHSDNLGSKKRNQEISEIRAQIVADYLILQGIDRKRIKVDALGDSEPLKPNDTEEGRADNRRVEFEIYK